MKPSELTDLARNLAHDLEQNGHDVSTADLLDSLACTSLTLAEDADGVATEAYNAIVEEG